MNIFKISWLNLISKPLGSALSFLLLSLGVSLISILLLLDYQLDQAFQRNISNIDMVVGAKGSPLQLILSSVYHIDNPTGNISLQEAEEVLKNPIIEKGIPLAYGDSYQGFRIVGTDSTFLPHYGASIAEGRYWEKAFEAVIGARLAKKLGLKLGDQFKSTHGLVAQSQTHDEHDFTVVGILATNGSVVDQLILTHIESVWETHAHAETDSSTVDSTEQEITAMLVKFRNKGRGMFIPRQINENTNLQAALPAFEINRLQEQLGLGTFLLRAIAYAIIFISGISVFISLLNALKDRKYELALLRTMGASRLRIFVMIILESLLLALIGYIVGLVLSRIGMLYIASFTADAYRYELTPWQFLPSELVLGLGVLLIAFLAATLPALKAFYLNISQTLADA